MSDCEFILIDTAGRSPTRHAEAQRAEEVPRRARARTRCIWCSPRTASQECVELAIERFGDVRVDKIIFTKLDEAAHVGVVLNVVRKVNKSLVVRHDRPGRAGRHRSRRRQAKLAQTDSGRGVSETECIAVDDHDSAV